MSSPVPPPPSGSQPSYGPPSGDPNPYSADAGHGQAPYGQPAYGQGPAQPYGYGDPSYPGGQRPSSGLAIAALVVGAISLLMAWIPVINIVSIIGGIVALVLGILALRKVKQGTAGGKGMAIAGTVLGGISLVASIIVNVALGAVISDAVDTVESGSAAASPSSAPVEPADAEQTVDTEGPADAAEPAVAPGDLLPLGQSAEVGDYTITVNGLNLNANEAIAAADGMNPPADGQYVIADISVVYNGTEEGNPWMDLSYIFMGTDNAQYDDGTCMAIEENSVVNVPTLNTGGAADYEVCMDVPAEAIEGGSFAVEPLFSFDESERATWAIS